jgi:hypothetical protein
MIDVDVDLVWNTDCRTVAPEPKLGAEDKQEHQHDNDQQHDCEYTSTAASRLDYGRVLALNFVAIIGHWKLSLFTLL